MFERIRKAVGRYGWSATGVFPDEDRDTPAFTYSCGFQSTIAQPDLVILGINPQLAHELLRILYREMKSGALRLSGEGVDADGIIENFPVRLVPLSDEIVQGFAYATIRWNDSEPTVMWQVILPDRNGLFPGDPGVDPAFVRGQDPSSLIDVGPEDDEVSP